MRREPRDAYQTGWRQLRPQSYQQWAKSQQQACLKRRDFRRLQRELRSLQDLLRCGWDVREELEETKRSLKRHFEEESERIVFRSKVENLEKGEKCNSFFFRKLHAGHTPMNELRDESGNMRRGKENVMKVVSDFYSELYARKTTDPEAADKFLSELFAEAIRRNGEIRGITAPGPERFEVKCSLYMDDVTVFCADRRSVDTLAKSQQQACLKRRDFRRLQRELRSLQDLLRCGWDVREELEETKRSLKRHFEEESERIVFRSKVENLEKGEKCNSFFFRKLHAGHTPMNELRDESGNMRRGKENVMKVVSDFYSELYARKTTDPEAADKFLSELFAEAIRRNGEIRGITAPGPERFEVKCSLYMDDVTVFCADRRSVDTLAKSQQQACLKRRDFRRLQRELRSLQDLLRCGWDVREELEETKRSLKRHFEEESERIVFRSKVENLEKGEKCNSFFFRKLHAGHTPMNELRDESGNMRRGKENVMKVVSDFYSELYARKTTDPEAADKFLSELFAEAIRRNGEIRGITAPGPERFEVKCSLYMDDVTVFCADRRSVDTLVQ
ncbi:uncharacterized protein ACNLHF_004603, partial [Anomaloglossus baeobatrachus]